jgi:sulfide:quinone oxidoreductase
LITTLGETPHHGGRGTCCVEFGDNRVARVDVTFHAGQTPFGSFEDPSSALAADKTEFGRSRIERWFGREWQPTDLTPYRLPDFG